jgi:hypothetical protein
LCPLPKITNRRASSISQEATVLTSSKHIIDIKNKKAEKANKDASSKVASRRKEATFLGPQKTQGRTTLNQNMCIATSFFSEEQIGEIWILCVQGNTWCHVECAGKTTLRDLCVEAVIKPRNNIPKRTVRIAGESSKMAKITICF